MARKKLKSTFPKWAKYLLLLVVICALAMAIFENKKYFRRIYRHLVHRYTKTTFRPSDFPDGYDIHGIDLSHYQEDVNWDKLRAIDQYGDTIPFKFAFIKATEGLLIEDGMFDEHWEDARDHKIIRGAYHYFLPDRSAKIQAANYMSSVKLTVGDLPPVVDVEEVRGKTKAEIVAELKEFVKIVEKRYNVKPIIYSNINFIEDFLFDDFKNYKFWVAHYYKSELIKEDSLQCLFWQHTDKADLLGIRGTVDANVFTGSQRDLERLLIR